MKDASPFAQALAESVGARQAFKVAIVAPVHVQPTEAWIGALKVASRTATIIIVDDSDGKVVLPQEWDIFGYERQREELGDELYEQFKMFHKSAACKQFGLWQAYKRGFDPIIVIDSDCVIPPDFVAKHIEHLLQYGQGWDNPLEGTGFYSRGFPYSERKKPVWAHMGLWENELDLYGTDRIGKDYIPKMPPINERKMPAGIFPLSGMNVSFRNDAVPYMLFLPNFMNGDEKFTRHDDIWGGYLFQRIAHAFGFALTYGSPVVYHDTIVVPEADAKEEEAMIKHERDYYRFVDDAMNMCLWWGQKKPTPTEVFEEMVDFLKGHNSVPQFNGLIPAYKLAAEMFREDE